MPNSNTQQKLEEEARKIEQQLTGIAEEEAYSESRDIENAFGDDLSETESGSRLIAVKDMLLDRLYDVRIALHKMRDRSYGVCDRCGAKISFKRLKAVPEANYCLECERKLEKQNVS